VAEQTVPPRKATCNQEDVHDEPMRGGSLPESGRQMNGLVDFERQAAPR